MERRSRPAIGEAAEEGAHQSPQAGHSQRDHETSNAAFASTISVPFGLRLMGHFDGENDARVSD
jgi:hypothetical protein